MSVFKTLTFFLLGLSFSLSSPQAKAIEYSKINRSAAKGNTLILSLNPEPLNLNPLTSLEPGALTVRDQIFDTLLYRDLNTLEWRSRLAESWEVSKDKKVFTFHLRKNLVFEDGHSLTAEDVKFSFDAILDPRFKAFQLRSYFQGIEKAEIVDSLTVKFFARNLHYQNFSVISSGLLILPRHIYSDPEVNEKSTRTLVGSGPYKLYSVEKNKLISLRRNDRWFGYGLDEFKGFYNFQDINFIFPKDENHAIELIKNGELDFYELKTLANILQPTQSAPWGQSIFRAQVENSAPKDYFFLGFNLKKDLFKDRNIRMALAMLVNRTEINRHFRGQQAELTLGPQASSSDFASDKVKPILFDPPKAEELLARSGWRDHDHNGILDKKINGKTEEFRFTLIHASKDMEKIYNFIKEDMRRVGIDMEIRIMDMPELLQQLDQGHFDAVGMGWNGVIDWDPRPIWHSNVTGEKNMNFISYKNSAVDRLIEKAQGEFQREKRIPILRKVYEEIANDLPYIFLLNDKYTTYVYSRKLGRPGETYKYDLGLETWWSR